MLFRSAQRGGAREQLIEGQGRKVGEGLGDHLREAFRNGSGPSGETPARARNHSTPMTQIAFSLVAQGFAASAWPRRAPFGHAAGTPGVILIVNATRP